MPLKEGLHIALEWTFCVRCEFNMVEKIIYEPHNMPLNYVVFLVHVMYFLQYNMVRREKIIYNEPHNMPRNYVVFLVHAMYFLQYNMVRRFGVSRF